VTKQARSTLIVFDPQIPLGARLLGAQCDDHRLAASMKHNEQDEHAHLAFSVTQGTAHCAIRFQGGVEVIPPQITPQLGDRSAGIKITSVEFRDHSLIVEADVNSDWTRFDIKTAWKPTSVDGGTIGQIAGNLYRVDFDRDERAPDSFGYTRRRAVINFEHAY
jgi:hypothetical protein